MILEIIKDQTASQIRDLPPIKTRQVPPDSILPTADGRLPISTHLKPVIVSPTGRHHLMEKAARIHLLANMPQAGDFDTQCPVFGVPKHSPPIAHANWGCSSQRQFSSIKQHCHGGPRHESRILREIPSPCLPETSLPDQLLTEKCLLPC